jgi:hypothetical protein
MVSKDIMVSKEKIIALLRSDRIDKIKLFNRYNRLIRFLRKFINLSGTDLSFINLNYANLSDVDLSDVNLNNSNLEYVNLFGANLRNVKLYNADLYNANLLNIIINNIRYDTENLIQLMQDNKDKILTVDYCKKENLCDNGIEYFIIRYDLKDEISLGELAEHNKIEDMLYYNNSYFIYIILRICNII